MKIDEYFQIDNAIERAIDKSTIIQKFMKEHNSYTFINYQVSSIGQYDENDETITAIIVFYICGEAFEEAVVKLRWLDEIDGTVSFIEEDDDEDANV